MTNKNIAVHVASLLSGAGAVVALIHPGFVIPAAVQAIVTSLCVLVAAGLQLVHLVGKQSFAQNIAMAAQYAAAVTKTAPAAPAAPEATPAPTTPVQ